MSPFGVRCPGCRSKYRIDNPAQCGKRMKCRSCRRVFLVPVPKSVVASASARDEFDDFGDLTDTYTAETDAGYDSPTSRQARVRRSVAPMRRTTTASKKPQKKKKGQPSKATMWLVMMGLFVGTLLAFTGVGFGVVYLLPRLAAGGNVKVEAPETFVPYEHPDSGVWFDCPEEWKVKIGGGSNGVAIWARINGRGARVSIRDTFTNAVVGNMAGPGDNLIGGFGGARGELDPVANMHREGLARVRDLDADYNELPPENINTDYGPGKLSRFIKSGSFDKGKTGFRATLPVMDSGEARQFLSSASARRTISRRWNRPSGGLSVPSNRVRFSERSRGVSLRVECGSSSRWFHCARLSKGTTSPPLGVASALRTSASISGLMLLTEPSPIMNSVDPPPGLPNVSGP